jgi:hypothetical protein
MLPDPKPAEKCLVLDDQADFGAVRGGVRRGVAGLQLMVSELAAQGAAEVYLAVDRKWSSASW